MSENGRHLHPAARYIPIGCRHFNCAGIADPPEIGLLEIRSCIICIGPLVIVPVLDFALIRVVLMDAPPGIIDLDARCSGCIHAEEVVLPRQHFGFADRKLQRPLLRLRHAEIRFILRIFPIILRIHPKCERPVVPLRIQSLCRHPDGPRFAPKAVPFIGPIRLLPIDRHSPDAESACFPIVRVVLQIGDPNRQEFSAHHRLPVQGNLRNGQPRFICQSRQGSHHETCNRQT